MTITTVNKSISTALPDRHVTAERRLRRAS